MTRLIIEPGYDKAAVSEAVNAMTEALLGFAEDEAEPIREVPDNIITNTSFEVGACHKS